MLWHRHDSSLEIGVTKTGQDELVEGIETTSRDRLQEADREDDPDLNIE